LGQEKTGIFLQKGLDKEIAEQPVGQIRGGPFEEVGAMCCLYLVREPTGADS
jgi:hypothetical protein